MSATLQEQERAAYQAGDYAAVALLQVAIDADEVKTSAENALINIHEAKAGFPDEDCLSDLISDLQYLARNMRGENRKSLMAAIEKAEELQLDIGRSTEHGLNELKQAERELSA